MKIRDKRLGIFLIVLAALTTAAVTLRTVACFSDFNSASFRFNDGVLFTVSTICVAACVLLAVCYVLFGSPRRELVSDMHGMLTSSASALAAVGFVFLGFELFGELFSGESIGRGLIVFAAALTAVASTVYFFLVPFLGKRYSEIRSYAGLAVLVCLLSYALYLFTDASMPINAPAKLIDQLAFALAGLFFLGEIRLSLGREGWVSYVFFGMIAASVCAYSSIPSLIIYFTGTESEAAPILLSRSITESVLTAALFIFISVRVGKVAFLLDDEAGEAAQMIFENAESVDADSEIISADTDENQISIDDLIKSEGQDEQ